VLFDEVSEMVYVTYQKSKNIYCQYNICTIVTDPFIIIDSTSYHPPVVVGKWKKQSTQVSLSKAARELAILTFDRNYSQEDYQR
jgi:hypothetical protein